jgi:hypothetical protein
VVILEQLVVDPAAFAARTGWAVKPEGACKGDICVPLPDSARTADGRLAAPVLAERLGMPLLHDDANQLWALGPASVSGRALDTAVAPDLELPDVDGNPFRLSSLHGKKVLLVAWASW